MWGSHSHAGASVNRLTRKTPLQSPPLATQKVQRPGARTPHLPGETCRKTPAQRAAPLRPSALPLPGQKRSRAAGRSAPPRPLPDAPFWWRAPLSPPSQTRTAFSAARSPGASWRARRAMRVESVPRNSDGSPRGEAAAIALTPHTPHAQAQRRRP